MNARQAKLWKNSFEYHFHHLFFRKLDEGLFSVLYSSGKTRPNTAVNQLVSALVLMHRFGWTYAELERQLNFNMLTRMSLGLWDVNEGIFCEKTLFNFQDRLSAHWRSSGENLLEQVFDTFSQAEMTRLGLKTSIQRGDSFLAASNIAHYSRLRLLVEVLRRLHRILSEADQAQYASVFGPYLKQSSSQYLYSVQREELPDELSKVGHAYHELYEGLKGDYGDQSVFLIFERVWQEHFCVRENQLAIIPNKELDSQCLQSPDDLDATFRKKGKQESQGSVIHISETAHPENPLQLLTDVAVAPNNTDDSHILEDRIEGMKAKTPDLEEYHTDGGYGSEGVDKKMTSEQIQITHVQTAIRGRKAAVEMQIHRYKDDGDGGETYYEVHCEQGQQVRATPTKKRFKATFEVGICQSCPLKDVCQTQANAKGSRVLYFTEADALKHRRWRNILLIPPERRKIRPNVEASVRQMKSNMKNNKLKVRGLFKAMIYAYATAIATNAARIAQFEGKRATDLRFWPSATIQWLTKQIKNRFANILRLPEIQGLPHFHNYASSEMVQKL